jgi:hypothetical protein
LKSNWRIKSKSRGPPPPATDGPEVYCTCKFEAMEDDIIKVSSLTYLIGVLQILLTFENYCHLGQLHALIKTYKFINFLRFFLPTHDFQLHKNLPYTLLYGPTTHILGRLDDIKCSFMTESETKILHKTFRVFLLPQFCKWIWWHSLAFEFYGSTNCNVTLIYCRFQTLIKVRWSQNVFMKSKIAPKKFDRFLSQFENNQNKSQVPSL